MKPFETVTGKVIPMLMADINTDQIIPSAYLRSGGKGQSHGLFAHLRKNADGSVDPSFPFENPQLQNAPILLAGPNFGCGSSRDANGRQSLPVKLERCEIQAPEGVI